MKPKCEQKRGEGTIIGNKTLTKNTETAKYGAGAVQHSVSLLHTPIRIKGQADEDPVKQEASGTVWAAERDTTAKTNGAPWLR